MMHQTRRAFFEKVVRVGPALLLPSVLVNAQATAPIDPIPPDTVRTFVGAAHRDLEQVRAMLAELPHLLNAAWDWGDGDFETALGAAGHVGRSDIALFLLENGARADIFVLTMLGETAIVKSMLERFPQLLHAIGPHGFTLLHHAERGGEPAEALFSWLLEKGMTERKVAYFKK